jgi:hypothetical protein
MFTRDVKEKGRGTNPFTSDNSMGLWISFTPGFNTTELWSLMAEEKRWRGRGLSFFD